MTDEVLVEHNIYYFMRERGKRYNLYRDNGPAVIHIEAPDYDYTQPIIQRHISISEAEQELADKTITGQLWIKNDDDITDEVEEFLNNKDWPDDYRQWTKKHWAKFKLRF
ncbi:hypothetical protein [Acetobacter orientalis]|uniref:Uncharacterized protein n=1 Tax=Acetobacter orientalis TaxID=146474 RepID=A0A251ZXZ5_9PROT|nr:hypothetical protein [Acetobacter orientalis]OUI79540.1 hypothetical protein HK12_13985 [Acetobacter orientalis]